MTEQDGSSLDVVNENLKALKAIFPESFTEHGVLMLCSVLKSERAIQVKKNSP